MSVCWLRLNVTTPMVWLRLSGSSYLFLISRTMARASPSFTRPFPRSKKPSVFTSRTFFSLSLTEGKVSMEFS